MEPLIHYSQRDPLYDTNFLSLNTDIQNEISKPEDLLSDTNHLSENVYGPPRHVIEKPVYIKEPEPIIEIIIKESNVTLPPPPAPPTPPRRKKEEVQVFYVKYKKNPNGHGKDSVIYDRPIPAISPPIDDHEEQQSQQQHYHQQVVTLPPPPSTTLRTIIRPDSETYHSPSGIKVTFGKEGFSYDKRSSKPEDSNEQAVASSIRLPQGRQLQSFSSFYHRRGPPSVTNHNFQSSNNFRSEPPRQPQPYRPFNSPPPPSPQFRPSQPQFGRPPPPPQFSSHPPKFPFQPPFTKSQPPQLPSRPPSPQFQQSNFPPPSQHFEQNAPHARQPVPYQPFESFKIQHQPPQPVQQSSHPINPSAPQKQIQFRPETHFPIQQQLPLSQTSHIFNQAPVPQSSRHLQTSPQNHHISQVSFQRDAEIQNQQLIQKQEALKPQQVQQDFHHPQNPAPQFSPQIQHNQFNGQVNHQQQQQQQQNEHLSNIRHVQNVLPPGGELIHSLPRYEQHISVLEPNQQQQPQALPLQSQLPTLSPQEYKQRIQEQFNQNTLQSLQQQNINQQQIQKNVQQQQQQQNNILLHQQQPTIPHDQLLQDYFGQNVRNQASQQSQNIYTTSKSPSFYQTTHKPTTYSTTKRITYQPTTEPSTTTQEPEKPSTTTKDPAILNAQLPDEVPDDLREQLLSSGILNHADISVLDYDKVGDIPLSALPPDQLANFYSAGGAQQISAGSEPVPSVVNSEGGKIDKSLSEGEAVEDDQEPEGTEIKEVKVSPEVEMKVVHYNPDTDKGQKVQEAYVRDDATQIDPVVLNDNTYNRYLPLKVSGNQFPIPDVPELKGKKISSVVVLAPVAYDFSSKRETREAKHSEDDIELIQDQALKDLLKNPSLENYKNFLENQNKTSSDKQSVILLVTNPEKTNNQEREIFMYDIATQTVSKLSGELSAAFVEAAEENSSVEEDDSKEESKAASSNIVETRVPYVGEDIGRQDLSTSDIELQGSASEIDESRVPIIDPMKGDLETEASEQLERFVDFSGIPVDRRNEIEEEASDLHTAESRVSISASYSQTGHS